MLKAAFKKGGAASNRQQKIVNNFLKETQKKSTDLTKGKLEQSSAVSFDNLDTSGREHVKNKSHVYSFGIEIQQS